MLKIYLYIYVIIYLLIVIARPLEKFSKKTGIHTRVIPVLAGPLSFMMSKIPVVVISGCCRER